jgi:transcriptional regulator with XRE-family HTH domain
MSRQRRTERTSQDRAYLSKIADNIREVRKRRGISQEEFAHIADFSRSYYTEIETGKRNVSILNLIKIADRLGVDPADLLRLS